MRTISGVDDASPVLARNLPPKEIVFGESESMKRLWEIVERVAGASVPILIAGENGTGKEILAQFIHSFSLGPRAPFMKVSPPIPDGQWMNEAAFRVEIEGERCVGSNGNSGHQPCTLFVENVDEVVQRCQEELLQLIQGLRPLILEDGADVSSSLRVICASTHDLEQAVSAGKFREDLFWFLSVVTLRLPPLRERKEDIPQLASYFWQIYSRRFDCNSDAPSRRLIDVLQQHDWPGNIRELENVMKRYVVLGEEGIDSIGNSAQGKKEMVFDSAAHHPCSLKELTREAAHALERKIILRTLQETQWNRRRTARALNISYRALLYKIKEGGLLSEQYKGSGGSSGGHTQKSNDEAA